MAKTNFLKAEEALTAALQKMSVEQLFEQASARDNPATEENAKRDQARLYIIKTLQLELKKLHRHDSEIYKKLGIKRKELDVYLEFPAKISSETWKKIVALKAKVEEFSKNLPEKTNDQLIEIERQKHITKRFNVNEKWLPLK